jgi:hypothetical protein
MPPDRFYLSEYIKLGVIVEAVDIWGKPNLRTNPLTWPVIYFYPFSPSSRRNDNPAKLFHFIHSDSPK